MIEVLDESQPWPIDLEPPEPPHDRKVEASRDGAPMTSWRWQDDHWRNLHGPARTWRDVIRIAIGSCWTLRSVPIATPLDAGAAAMVTAQSAAHARVPGIVPFDALTERHKDEWRAVFKAGLDAYRAAGGET